MKRIFLSILTIITLATALTSCLKNNVDTVRSVEPAMEKDTIQKFIAMNGYEMTEDPKLPGYMFQILDHGSETDTLSNARPVVDVKYKFKLMNNTVVEETEKATFNLSQINLIAPFTYSLTKIGKGGHIRFVTPSAYAYGPYAQGKVPANSPLFYDLELLDIREQ